MALDYKILTQDGTDNNAIDGARDRFFASGNRDGIYKGSLNEGKLIIDPSNGVKMDTFVLLISGNPIIVDKMWGTTFSSKPSTNERYSIVAQLTVDDNNRKTFDILVLPATTKLVKQNLFKTLNSSGTYQVEIGRFTLNTKGLVENLTRTIDVITGGGTADSELHWGKITTNTLGHNVPAEADFEQRYDEEKGYMVTDVTLGIPSGSIDNLDSTLSTESHNAIENQAVTGALNNKMDKTNPTGTGSLSLNRRPDSVVGDSSSTLGIGNMASGRASHAEGVNTEATGAGSHAEGGASLANGDYSHAEGGATANGTGSHAEGRGTIADGAYSHAEGLSTLATGEASHAEGRSTRATGSCSHAEGYNTEAKYKSQHVFGEFNIADTAGVDKTVRGTYVEIVGNGTTGGTGEVNRSNARTLDWEGNEWLAGNLEFATGKTVKVPTPTENEDAVPKSYADSISTPIGSIVIWSGSNNAVPANFLICNGAAVSRTTYATLYKVIGTAYGEGDGSTTFNLPNLIDRFVVGAGGTYERNASGGSVNHSHGTSSLYAGVTNYAGEIAFRNRQNVSTWVSDHTISWSGTVNEPQVSNNYTQAAQIYGTTDESSNMPPYLGLYYIIRAI